MLFIIKDCSTNFSTGARGWAKMSFQPGDRQLRYMSRTPKESWLSMKQKSLWQTNWLQNITTGLTAQHCIRADCPTLPQGWLPNINCHRAGCPTLPQGWLPNLATAGADSWQCCKLTWAKDVGWKILELNLGTGRNFDDCTFIYSIHTMKIHMHLPQSTHWYYGDTHLPQSTHWYYEDTHLPQSTHWYYGDTHLLQSTHRYYEDTHLLQSTHWYYGDTHLLQSTH